MQKSKINHIGIIPDGNRRFAKALMKKPWKGHEYGLNKIRDILEWCRELEIKYVTLYAFSIENFKRPKKEFDMIMKILKNELDSIISDKNHDVHKHKIRIKFIGRREMLSKELQNTIEKAEKMTAEYNKYFLNLAVAYGGRIEIVDACKGIAKNILTGKIKIESLNEETFKKYLYDSDFPDPDLIIRTSEQRLSGFMIWQSAYSEFVFIPKTFPDFQKQDFLEAIDEYYNRERRFGK